MSAATVLAAAIANGTDRLSTRDCWVCIAYLYASGNSAQTQLNAAIANGYDRLSTTDLKRAIASILNP